MRTTKRLAALILALLLAALSFSAVAEEKTTLTLWINQPSTSEAGVAWQEGMLNQFVADHPEIDLQIEWVANTANDAMQTKVSTALAADALPDIFTYWLGSNITGMVSDGVLMDASEYFARTTFDPKSIADGAWDYCTYEGIVRGFPANGFRMAWFCNSAIFDELGLKYPETMDDVIAMAPAINAAGYIPLAYGSSGANPGQYLISEIQYQYEGGAEAITQLDATNQIDTPSYRKAAEQILALQEAGVFPKDTIANGDWTPSFELYNSGRAAMCYTASYVYGSMNDDIFDKTVLINVPKAKDADVDSSTIAMSSANFGLCVQQKAWAESDAKKAAITAFLDAYLNKDFQQLYADATGNVSTFMDVTAKNKVDAAVQAFYYNGTRTIYPCQYNVVRYRPGWEAIKPFIDDLFAGNMTVEEFALESQACFDPRYK